jgi:hypothetical protein
MATLRPMPRVTLDWPTWALVAVIVFLVVLLGVLFVGG